MFTRSRRRQEWQQVAGYHVGDVHSEQPVWLLPDSTLVGSIVAPAVRIGGLLYGTLVAVRADIEQNGQVWGDVYATQLTLQDGGKVQGWVSTLSEADFAAYAVGDSGLDVAGPTESQGDVLEDDEAGERTLVAQDPEQARAIRVLQQEAAVALAARAELEQSFDKRLSEMASKASARSVALGEALESTQSELAELRPRVEALEEELRLREDHIAQQTRELDVARRLLGERQQALDELEAMSSDQQEQMARLTAEKAETEAALQQANVELKGLRERLGNLETAMQGSLQHTSELEESLLRWQELAEFTEARVQELEQALGAMNEKYATAVSQHATQSEEIRSLLAQIETQKQALQKADEKASKQNHLIREIKRITSQRIQMLQDQLARSQPGPSQQDDEE